MPTFRELMDDLKSEVAQMRETIQAHEAKESEFDLDAMETRLRDGIDAHIQARMDQAERERPHDEGAWIGPAEGLMGQSGGRVTTPGKFYGQKRDHVLWAGAQMRKLREAYPSHVAAESPEMTKLMDATTAGSGDEWVPTGMAAELWDDFFIANKVATSLPIIQMPTDPFDTPAVGEATWRKGTPGEATASADLASFKSTLTSTELIAEVNWGYDLNEDAILAMLPLVRQELGRSGSEIIDKFVMNADATAAATGNINLDDSTPATDAYYLSNGQDGIRHYYLVDRTGQSTDVNSTLDDAEWRAGVARMGKYAASPSQVIAFTNIKTYLLSLMGLTNVRTLDLYGPSATILTGELAKIDGIAVVPTEAIELAEDDGKVSNTAGNNDEGQIALVNRMMWHVGFKRQLMIEMERDIQKRIFIMVASIRIAVGCRDDGYSTSRGKDHTAGIHGITYS